MKILGKTEGGFIVEMLKEELCKLRGKTYENDLTFVAVGSFYEISDVWHRIRNIKERRVMLTRHANELRAYADLLEYKEPEINKEVENDG